VRCVDGPQGADQSADGVGGDPPAAADVDYFESAVGDELVDGAAAQVGHPGGLVDDEQGWMGFRQPQIELSLNGHACLRDLSTSKKCHGRLTKCCSIPVMVMSVIVLTRSSSILAYRPVPGSPRQYFFQSTPIDLYIPSSRRPHST
jgi:hypothetical protein